MITCAPLFSSNGCAVDLEALNLGLVASFYQVSSVSLKSIAALI